MKKRIKVLKKVTVVISILIAIISMVKYLDFPPDSMTGSAIKGVQKANKYKIEDDTEVELEGEDLQILLQNDEFQELLKDDNFNKFLHSANFTEFIENTNLDTTNLGEFKGLLNNQKFKRLSNTNTFSILAKNPQYLDMFKY